MVSNFETDTETFPSWCKILRLRLRLWIGVSNFETETLLVWFQTLRLRMRPARSQILRPILLGKIKNKMRLKLCQAQLKLKLKLG